MVRLNHHTDKLAIMKFSSGTETQWNTEVVSSHCECTFGGVPTKKAVKKPDVDNKTVRGNRNMVFIGRCWVIYKSYNGQGHTITGLQL